MGRMTFPEWLAELDAEAKRRGYRGASPCSKDPPAWRPYYEGGHSPVSALDDDESYYIQC